MTKLIVSNNKKWMVLATVCFALFMIVLDGNVVNLAIPKILVDFNASISQLEWISNAYLLTFAIFLIAFGRLGDRFGRKLFFMIGIVLFSIGSAFCGISQNIDQLVIFRIIQGMGGAAMMPATLSLIAANFERKERGTAMGIWGAVSGVAIVLGPIIGGYLTDIGLGGGINSFFHVNEFWRYVFYINIPVGVIAFISAIFNIPESKDQNAKSGVDFIGVILSALSIFSLTYAFIEGQKYGWWYVNNPFVFGGVNMGLWHLSIIPYLFLLFVVFLILFVYYETHAKNIFPIVDFKLFRNRNFAVGNFATTILSFSMFGAFFLLPLFLQVVLGFSAIETGKSLLPLAFAVMIAAPVSGRLADKFGAKYIVVIGMCMIALGGYLLANFHVDTTTRSLILPYIVLGLGMGMSLAPSTTITLLNIPEEEVGGASGVLTTFRQIGSVMGIAILGALLQSYLVANIKTEVAKINDIPPIAKTQIVSSVEAGGATGNNAKLAENIQKDLYNLMSSGMPNQAIQPNQAKIQALFVNIGKEIEGAFKQSFVDAINKTFKHSIFGALGGALIALLFHNQKPENRKKEAPGAIV